MDVAQASELINKTSVNRDGSEMISLFNGHKKRSKYGLATNLHRICLPLPQNAGNFQAIRSNM